MSETVLTTLINSAAVILAALLSFALARNLNKYTISWVEKDLVAANGKQITTLSVRIENPKHKSIKVKLDIEGFTRKGITNNDSTFGCFIYLTDFEKIQEIKTNSSVEVVVGFIKESQFNTESLPVLREKIVVKSELKRRMPYPQKSYATINTAEALSKSRLRSSTVYDYSKENDLWDSLLYQEICEVDCLKEVRYFAITCLDSLENFSRLEKRKFFYYLFGNYPTYWTIVYLEAALESISKGSRITIKRLLSQMQWGAKEINDAVRELMEYGFQGDFFEAVYRQSIPDSEDDRKRGSFLYRKSPDWLWNIYIRCLTFKDLTYEKLWKIYCRIRAKKLEEDNVRSLSKFAPFAETLNKDYVWDEELYDE